MLLEVKAASRHREAKGRRVGELAVLGLRFGQFLVHENRRRHTAACRIGNATALQSQRRRAVEVDTGSLPRAQQVRVTRRVCEDLHPGLDDVVRLLEQLSGIGLLLRLPEGVRCRQSKGQECLECPVRRLSRVVVLHFQSAHDLMVHVVHDAPRS